MTEPQQPLHDADSQRRAETPSYEQGAFPSAHADAASEYRPHPDQVEQPTPRIPGDDDATREIYGSAGDATREMPASAAPLPPTDTPGAAAARADSYLPPIGAPYAGYAAPEASATPTVVVTKKGPGWVALVAAMILTVAMTLGAVLYLRPALLRASTPTNMNGGTVSAVPASSSDGTD